MLSVFGVFSRLFFSTVLLTSNCMDFPQGKFCLFKQLITFHSTKTLRIVTIGFRTPQELRGAIKIQSADEDSATLRPRHLLPANQHSPMEEERGDLIGVVASWGVVLFAQGCCISQACMAACYEAPRPLKFPLSRTFQRLHEETKLCCLRVDVIYLREKSFPQSRSFQGIGKLL